MKSSDALPRLSPEKVVRGKDDAANSPQYLARLSWQKSLLETHDGNSSKLHSLSGSASAPALLPVCVPWASPGKTSVKGVVSLEESMDEVERMVREHMAHVQRERTKGKKGVSTLKQSAMRRDPTTIEFEFAPLRDPAMLAATTDLHDSEENDGDADEGDTDRRESRDGGEATTSNKYFGANAREAYYETYQELHGKVHLFVEKPRANRPQAKTLKASSALNSALELRKASALLSIAQLSKQGRGTTSSESSESTSSIVRRRLALQPLRGSLSGLSRANTEDPNALTSSPSLHSPRVLFLSSCIAKSHPAISLVLRKENCSVFDFSHQSLGDDFIIQFAACLPDLPRVEAINVSDNRLSDHALNELLLALENKPNLTKLDISENEIGRTSARSLRKYIASSLCTIKTLVLNDADIDDHECTLFMMAFERNKSVEKLLMASNRIGQTRKSLALGAAASVASTLPSDKDAAGAVLPTGGEAIGSMLNVNLTIQELDLSWNMLRQSSTAPIATSLQLNYNLLHLNLSYNGCGDVGAMQLGHALRSNSTLRKLNLAYNSIGPKGGMVLASGLIVNKGLKDLVLDGNAIGLDSGRELMHASCTRIHSTAVCALSMFECNLTSAKRAQHHDGKAHLGKDDLSNTGSDMNVYNPSDPTGRYYLDLADPYEHMIAHELLRLATFKRGYRFGKLEYSTAGQPKANTKIELQRETRKRETIPPQVPEGPTRSTQNSLSILFSKIDKDSSGFVDQHELAEAMKTYGLRISDELLSQVLNEYDYDKSGALGVDEFEDFFLRCGFAMIDTDHSGSLNEQEIEKVLKLMGFESITEREVKRMIAQYDLNNSGEIDEQEFMEFVKSEILECTLPDQDPGISGENASATVAQSLEEKYESIALRDPSGVIWKVPTSGFLCVEFLYDVDAVSLEDDAQTSPTEDHAKHGHPIGRTSQLIANTAISTLLESSQKMSKSSEEQAEFLSAVLDTSDLFFTAAQAEDVLTKQGAMKSWPRKLHALQRILAQMVNRHEASTLVNNMIDPTRQWQQRRELRRAIPKLYSILLGCPTNRFRFDLQNPVDRVALKQLATLAQEEKLFSKNRSGRNDTSQNGDWENFRHARVNGHVWLLTSTFILNSLLGPSNLALLKKTAPTVAASAGGFVEASQVKRFVEFDYVSTTRPPRGSKALTARRFDQLMEVWLNSESILNDNETEPVVLEEGVVVKTNAQLWWEILRNHVRSRRKLQGGMEATAKMSMVQIKATLDGIQKKIELLEMLISDRWISCEQAAALIAVLPDAIFARARAAVLLFSRIVDLENFVSIFDSLSREDQGECVKRLGWLNILDPVKPDRQYPPLNLSIRDERELVQLLSKLALTEGRECWKRPSYRPSLSEPTSTINQALPLPLWGNPDATGDESLKHHGIIRLRYQSGRIPSLTGDEDEFAVVRTVIGMCMLSRSPVLATGYMPATDTRIRQLDGSSVPIQLDGRLVELLAARVVSIRLNSTSQAHLGFVLNGTLVPRPFDADLFDGEFAFGDAHGPQRFAVIVRDRGYEWIKSGNRLEPIRCLSPAQFPPLHQLWAALSSARSASDGSVQFSFVTDVYRLKYNNGDYHVTSSSGVDMWLTPRNASLQPLPDVLSKVNDLPPCPRLFESAEGVPGRATDYTQAQVDTPLTLALADDECPCTFQDHKKCLFLHGIGVHKDVGLVGTYPEYWGNIDKMLPCCSEVKFAHLNTVDSPWYGELLAERVCDAMISVSHNTSYSLANETHPRQHYDAPLVKDTVVIAHSTGNLHLASALLYGKCQLDRATSKWIAIQGPMRGTNTANRVLEECAKPASGWDTLVQTVVREFELCPVKSSTQSLVLADTPASHGCLDKLFVKAQDVYEKNVYANLCGVSPFGLASTSSAKFVALAKFSNHSSANNDGVVDFGSCAKRDTEYQATYRHHNRFYKASINHDDGRLIHGDGLWGDNRRPIKWLQCQF